VLVERSKYPEVVAATNSQLRRLTEGLRIKREHTVKQIGRIKKRPATVEIGTTKLRALGTSLAGSATSSAMEVIMPMAAKV
jgi:hypothetical protein